MAVTLGAAHLRARPHRTGDRPSTDRSRAATGDVLFIEWTAKSSATRVEDGIDTFVFRDGLIRVQTVRYTLLDN